jgi:phosphopantothenoylcysteine decarboxylase/phosphopantothenate--cysteine ligase
MRILLIITGSIAAYKALDIIRECRQKKADITCVLTQGAKEFVTPLSVAALSEKPVYEALFSLKDETEMGHIRLAREHDVILVAPASANIIAKMAHGLADDLASTLLVAADIPVCIAPAMNHVMWNNKAVQRNVACLRDDGVTIIDPVLGSLACGETGMGRLAEVGVIAETVLNLC